MYLEADYLHFNRIFSLIVVNLRPAIRGHFSLIWYSRASASAGVEWINESTCVCTCVCAGVCMHAHPCRWRYGALESAHKHNSACFQLSPAGEKSVEKLFCQEKISNQTLFLLDKHPRFFVLKHWITERNIWKSEKSSKQNSEAESHSFWCQCCFGSICLSFANSSSLLWSPARPLLTNPGNKKKLA